MSTKGAIKAVIATQFDDTGLRKAQKQIAGIGKSLKGVLGTLGIATSVGALAQQLEQAARAAGQDAKSYDVLANTLRNVAGASDTAIKSADAYIQKLQFQIGVADDQLRPVLGRLVSATGDLAKSQDLLAVAADLAASKNIDLGTAGNALAKAVAGQTTALFRLAPELKKSGDWMATLKANTEGAAATAANADPFQRLTTIFGDMQEKIGYALLPAMQSLANYISSNSFQDGFGKVAKDFSDIVTGLGVVGDQVGLVVTTINNWLDQLGINFDVMGFVHKFLPMLDPFYALLDNLKALGAEKNKTSALNAGSGVNTNSLEGILKASGTLKTYVPEVTKTTGATKKLTTENKALTDAIAKAKAAFDAKVKAYQDAVKAAQDIIDSTKETTAAFVDLFKVQPKMGDFEKSLVDGFSKIYDTIKSSLADKRILQSSADSLTKYADSSIAAMQAIAKQRDILAGKLDVARTITAGVVGLANITSMLDTTTKSVTESATAMANGIQTIITKTYDVTTTGGLVDNFQKLVDKTKAYAKNLIELKKLGLDKNLFAQLVNAGADAGGATAQAIVDGGQETVSALNDLFGQLNLSAADIAQTSTDIMYQVGQDIISNGFIDGLQSQMDALQTQAETMAKSFADAFNTALAGALQVALPAMPVPAGNDLTSTLANRPSPTRSPQRYAAWLAGIGGIDPLRSPQSYAAAQSTYNITLNTGVVTSAANVGQEIVTFIKSYERATGSVWQSA